MSPVDPTALSLAHGDLELEPYLDRWTATPDPSSDLENGRGAKIGISGPTGRWWVRLDGRLLRGPGGGVRWFGKPSRACAAAELEARDPE